MNMVYLPALSALAGTLLGATLTAAYTYINSAISRRIRQRDLCRMVKAELLNLQRHARLAASELQDSDRIETFKKAKYNQAGLIILDVKELYVLSENLCQDIMQVSLYSRNNDIEIDSVLESYKEHGPERWAEEAKEISSMIMVRFQVMTQLCASVIENIEKHIRNPDRYREPQISW